ncbi:hypothetical protein EVAR_39325_1 [Eumeta japonica]|uniref:Uncharacterized protein n=1 Tax=Eumeta variegata TaxID=151549 RepID=A0A4C1WRP2_EUMVA|nr:hypothetical protein EVAR_39325_1 [Eumeta japonica]
MKSHTRSRFRRQTEDLDEITRSTVRLRNPNNTGHGRESGPIFMLFIIISHNDIVRERNFDTSASPWARAINHFIHVSRYYSGPFVAAGPALHAMFTIFALYLRSFRFYD